VLNLLARKWVIPILVELAGAVVDVGLAHPAPHRLHPVAELLRDPLHRPMLGPKLRAELADQSHRLGLLVVAVPTRRGLP
jgi:hypothetical protein